jgi:hypothetical protein
MAEQQFKTDKNVTPDYINRKMESVMAAIFDTLQEYEERFRELEEQVTQLSIKAFNEDESKTQE